MAAMRCGILSSNFFIPSAPVPSKYRQHAPAPMLRRQALPQNTLTHMVSAATFRQIARSFPETAEHPHFEKTSFKVHKKIFATLDAKNHLACVKLSETDQDVFSAFDRSVIFPVPNKWGKQGWTFVDLKKVRKRMLTDALTTAYATAAPARLVVQLASKEEK